MALMQCPECSKNISTKAKACPHCGYPLSPNLVEAKSYNTPKTSIDELNNCDAINKSMTSSLEKSNKSAGNDIKRTVIVLIAITILITIISFAENSYQNKVHEKRNSERKAALSREYSNAKSLLNKSNITMPELLKVNDAVGAVTNDMSEFTEAKSLLTIISAKIELLNKENIKKENREKIAERIKEESVLNAKGKRLRSKHPDWTIEECDTISKGEIYVGMTKEQVAAAWGKPYHINKTVNALGVSEQWVMRETGNNYVYFENGICTAFQN